MGVPSGLRERRVSSTAAGDGAGVQVIWMPWGLGVVRSCGTGGGRSRRRRRCRWRGRRSGCGVEELDAVGEEGGGGFGGEVGGEYIGGGGGAGLGREAEGHGAGSSEAGGAADLGRHGAFDGDAGGGLGGGGPVEIDGVADALGGEVFDGLGEVEGGSLRGSRTGAADCAGCKDRGGGREPLAGHANGWEAGKNFMDGLIIRRGFVRGWS